MDNKADCPLARSSAAEMKKVIFILIVFNALRGSGCVRNASISEWLSIHDLNNDEIVDAIKVLSAALIKVSPEFDLRSAVLQTCLQMQCSFYCYNGRQTHIAQDIQAAKNSATDKVDCPVVHELHLYYYRFPADILPAGFLGEYSDKVVSIYIVKSNVTSIAAGAFGTGIFQRIWLEDLKLQELDMSFFTNVSNDFQELSVLQRKTNLRVITPEFLQSVKYQIRSLTIQAGINCIRNLTGLGSLLPNLDHVDFKYNRFGRQLTPDAFNQLSVVDHLDLAYCELEILPAYVFASIRKTLKYLNISNNRLLTIDKIVFGWGDMPEYLKIYANDNPWMCDCVLRREMLEIFAYQLNSEIYCTAPPLYKGLSVFDGLLCELFLPTDQPIQPSTNTMPTTTMNSSTTTAYSPTTTISTTVRSTTTTMATIAPTQRPSNVVTFCCPQCKNMGNLVPPKPILTFFAKANAVNISMDVSSDKVHRLFWFSSPTFGPDCYDNVPQQLTVENLLPDKAYTFCVVTETAHAPFSCKSVNVGGNMQVNYSSHIHKNVRATRICILVFGIVLFLFLGISAVFLVLKHKPVLLKGSKRVLQPKGSTKEVVVLPKHNTVQQIQHKEAMLARYQTNRYPLTYHLHSRRSSVQSISSTDSYMYNNLYEDIPDYLMLEDIRGTLASQPVHDAGYSRQPPTLQHYAKASAATLRRGASNHTMPHPARAQQMPRRPKRCSSDPLPELPTSHSARVLPVLPRVSDASALYATVHDCPQSVGNDSNQI